MASTKYKIQSDSINVGGIDTGVSSRYGLLDTIGEVATGDSETEKYLLRAGYRQMDEIYLAMTAASDVFMSPSLGGVTGGTSNGSTSFTVKTDSPSGYQVTITASTSPALQSSADSFADYVTAGATPDFTFLISNGTSAFGFTPEGDDIAPAYKDNGGDCGAGDADASDKCWDGLSTSPKVIVSRSSANHPSGVLTTLKFQAEVKSPKLQLPGTYTATTTITTTAL